MTEHIENRETPSNIIEFVTKDGTIVILNTLYRTITIRDNVYDVSKIIELANIVEDNVPKEAIS